MKPTANMIPLALVSLVVTAIVGFIVVVLLMSWFSNPPFGLGNAPPQPIAFPHTVHAGSVETGGVGIQCEFCHRNVTKGAAATVPAVETCVFCHKQINQEKLVGDTNVNLAEVQRVVDRFADGNPIDWERVYRLPDHVRFVHEAHIRFLTQGDPRTVDIPLGGGGTRQLPMPVGAGLLGLPRRGSRHDPSPASGRRVSQDGDLPGLPPAKQRGHRLHYLS